MESHVINVLKAVKLDRCPSKLSNQEILGYINQIYKSYTGQEHSYIYNLFTTPGGKMLGETKTVAWYQTNYDIPGMYNDSPDVDYTGFIPDAINHVIFSDKGIMDKVKTLNLMFVDLLSLVGFYEDV